MLRQPEVAEAIVKTVVEALMFATNRASKIKSHPVTYAIALTLHPLLLSRKTLALCLHRAKLIFCDRPANHNSLFLALNCNSALNVGYRLKVIVQTLNLQTKQEAIAAANSISLNLNLSKTPFQIV